MAQYILKPNLEIIFISENFDEGGLITKALGYSI